MKYCSDIDKKRKPVWKSIAKDCNHTSYPTRGTSHDFIRLFLDLLSEKNTLWFEKPYQKSKKPERAINPEI